MGRRLYGKRGSVIDREMSRRLIGGMNKRMDEGVGGGMNEKMGK